MAIIFHMPPWLAIVGNMLLQLRWNEILGDIFFDPLVLRHKYAKTCTEQQIINHRPYKSYRGDKSILQKISSIFIFWRKNGS